MNMTRLDKGTTALSRHTFHQAWTFVHRCAMAMALVASAFVVTPPAAPAQAAPSGPNYSDAPYAQTQLIHPPNAHDSMRFGAVMAVSGNTLAVPLVRRGVRLRVHEWRVGADGLSEGLQR